MQPIINTCVCQSSDDMHGCSRHARCFDDDKRGYSHCAHNSCLNTPCQSNKIGADQEASAAQCDARCVRRSSDIGSVPEQ